MGDAEGSEELLREAQALAEEDGEISTKEALSEARRMLERLEDAQR